MKLTSKDRFIAKTNSQSLENGLKLKLVAVGIITQIDYSGEKKVGVLKADDGKIYTTISNTVITLLPELGEMIDEDEVVTVAVVQRKSKSNREYFTLELL